MKLNYLLDFKNAVFGETLVSPNTAYANQNLTPNMKSQRVSRTLSVIVILSLLFTLTNFAFWVKPVSATSVGIDWYAGQDGNPWQGSPFTFEYYFNGNFVKMEKYNALQTRWETDESQVFIETWFARASNSKYSSVVYNASTAGLVTIENGFKLQYEGDSKEGEFIILQSDGVGYSPLWPNKGNWEWQNISNGQSIEFSPIKTYLNSTDKIYFILRAKNVDEYCAIRSNPKLDFVANATDLENIRPSTYSLFGGQISLPSTTFVNSWYVNNTTTNSTTDSNPFAYIKGKNGIYNDLLVNRKNFSGANFAWTDSNDAPPWIGPWFISANPNVDGVVEFTANESGSVLLSSSIALEIMQKGTSDGLKAMIVQKDASGKYYPLWPANGVFSWQILDDNSKITLPAINTGVVSGDKILYIVCSTGNSTNDTLNIDPKILFTPNSVLFERPTLFYPWNDDSDPNNPPNPTPTSKPAEPTPTSKPTTYSNSWYVNSKTTNSRVDDSPFAYTKGSKGVYEDLLTNRKNFSGTNFAWTNTNEAPPWISSWFISANPNVDGVVEFTVPTAGAAVLESNVKIEIGTKGKSDGFNFLIVQKDINGKYSPLYPHKGEWIWQGINDTTSLDLEVSTGINAGDKILFIVNSTGGSVNDTLNIDPKITIYHGATEIARPVKFDAWSVKETDVDTDNGSGSAGEVYANSWYINNKTTNSDIDTNPYAYLKGTKGVYSDFLTNRKKLSGSFWAWTNKNEGAPWVGPWFLSAHTGIDGVIEFTADVKGVANIKSNVDLSIINKNVSDGLNFMIVQEDKSGKYYPLFPDKGIWNWQTVNDLTKIKIDLTTMLNAGDKILFIANSSGTPVHDTVNIDPKITFHPNAENAIRPVKFSAWSAKEPGKDPKNTYHSQYFSIESSENGPFSYLGGYDGIYEPLDLYRNDWNGWTRGGAPPSVGINYISATLDNDAVISYKSPGNGLLKITSKTQLALTYPDKCDGVNLIIVLKNDLGEHPLWPKNGEWEYISFVADKKIDLPEISTYTRTGDEIHIICRSVGGTNYDTIIIDPAFKLDTTVPDDGIILNNIKRKVITQNDYIAGLPDIKDLKIDSPYSENKSVKPIEKKNIFPLQVAIPLLLITIIVIGVIISLIISSRRKKFAKSKN